MKTNAHKPKVLVVDEHDRPVGVGTLAEIRQQGLLCRIVRIMVFNKQGETYVQQRSLNKGSDPGKWAESVAGHVDEGEDYKIAAHREALEELGLSDLKLEEVAHFHLGVGDRPVQRFNKLYQTVTDQEPAPNPDEVAGGKWIGIDELRAWIKRAPDDFTFGFRQAFSIFESGDG